MNNKYLLWNRILVAVGAIIAIWTDSPVSEIAASISTIMWLFMADCIKIEKKIIKRCCK